jgi:hypothetical protein
VDLATTTEEAKRIVASQGAAILVSEGARDHGDSIDWLAVRGAAPATEPPIPVVLLTHHHAGSDHGANAALSTADFRPQDLVDTVGRLLVRERVQAA